MLKFIRFGEKLPHYAKSYCVFVRKLPPKMGDETLCPPRKICQSALCDVMKNTNTQLTLLYIL